jgi:hypothetical protein
MSQTINSALGLAVMAGHDVRVKRINELKSQLAAKESELEQVKRERDGWKVRCDEEHEFLQTALRDLFIERKRADELVKMWIEPSPELKKAFAPYVMKFGEHIETIRIGDFRLTRMATGGIWIGEADGGEGGEFKEAAIEGVIAKFYAENF